MKLWPWLMTNGDTPGIEWWSSLASSFPGGKVERLSQTRLAVMGEEGLADFAILGELGLREFALCVTFPEGQDPIELREQVLGSKKFVAAVSPFARRISKRLKVEAGRAWLYLPLGSGVRTGVEGGWDEESRALVKLVKAFCLALTAKVSVEERLCVFCCSERAELHMQYGSPRRICSKCQGECSVNPNRFSRIEGQQEEDCTEVIGLSLPVDSEVGESFAKVFDAFELDDFLAYFQERECCFSRYLRLVSISSFVVFLLIVGITIPVCLSSQVPLWGKLLTFFASAVTSSVPLLYGFALSSAQKAYWRTLEMEAPSSHTGALSEDDYRSFLSHMEAARKRDDLALPDEVVLTGALDLFVDPTERGSTLYLGAPLPLLLSEEDFSALFNQQLLLAQEAGKYGQDRLLRGLNGMGMAHLTFKTWLSKPYIGVPLEVFLPPFDRIFHEFSALWSSFKRKLEYRADELQAKSQDRETFAKALVQHYLMDSYLDLIIEDWPLASMNLDEGLSAKDFVSALNEGFSTLDEKSRVDFFDMAMTQVSLWSDTSPSLKDRVAALGVELKGVFRDGEPKTFLEIDSLPRGFEKDLDQMADEVGSSLTWVKRLRKNARKWLKRLENLGEEAPDSPFLKIQYALAANAAQHREEAASAVRCAVELDGDNEFARTRLLYWSLRSGQMGEAAWNISTLIRQAPDNKTLDWVGDILPQPWSIVTQAQRRLVLFRLLRVGETVLKEQGREDQLRLFHSLVQDCYWNFSRRSEALISAFLSTHR